MPLSPAGGCGVGICSGEDVSTGLELKGTVADCIRLNLNLRCASQVLYSLKQFTANSPEEVYRTLIAFPWEDIMASVATFQSPAR